MSVDELYPEVERLDDKEKRKDQYSPLSRFELGGPFPLPRILRNRGAKFLAQQSSYSPFSASPFMEMMPRRRQRGLPCILKFSPALQLTCPTRHAEALCERLAVQV